MICDLAETYHILDYKGLPLSLLATLVAGLGENSRIKRKLLGIEFNYLSLMTVLADKLSLIHYAITPGDDIPYMYSDAFVQNEEVIKSGFESPEDFERAWRGGGD